MDHTYEYARAAGRKRLWWLPLALVLVLALGTVIWYAVKPKAAEDPADPSGAQTSSETQSALDRDNFHTGLIDGKLYYVLEAEYTGEYNVQEVCFLEEDSSWMNDEITVVRVEDYSRIPEDFPKQTVLSYADYAAYCEQWGLEPAYTDPDKAYAIVSGAEVGATRLEFQLADVIAENETVTVYLRDRLPGYAAESFGFVLTIPVDPSVKELKYQSVCSPKEYENLVKYGVMYNPDETAAPEKPVIYLYPETETEVRVRLDYDGVLTCTYPAYDDGWTVTAAPDGTLTDAAGKTYSYLYWEGEGPADFDFSEGFCVRGADTAAFLEQALPRLGLNAREANEFIVYWLPRMEKNPWNLIAFQGGAYTDTARLEIQPEPDSLIRVFMAWRALTGPIELEPQPLDPPARTGFTVVEWGGAELPAS